MKNHSMSLATSAELQMLSIIHRIEQERDAHAEQVEELKAGLRQIARQLDNIAEFEPRLKITSAQYLLEATATAKALGRTEPF